MNKNLQKNKCAFTIIELIFAVVIVGILAAIAVPKLAAAKNQAAAQRYNDALGIMISAITRQLGESEMLPDSAAGLGATLPSFVSEGACTAASKPLNGSHFCLQVGEKKPCYELEIISASDGGAPVYQAFARPINASEAVCAAAHSSALSGDLIASTSGKTTIVDTAK